MGLLFHQRYEEVLVEFVEWYTQYTVTGEEASKIVQIYCRMKEENE